MMKTERDDRIILTSGRALSRRSGPGAEQKPRRHSRFSESFLFTVGLAVLGLYFVFLLTAAPHDVSPDRGGDAVGVFAEYEEMRSDDAAKGGIWARLGECLEDAFGKGEEQEK